ncbi:SanA/YdcF family protein [Oerskovia flava]|uniref:SanA/YdcF family protein n=1 Tax=Oerskovia flava TaxID=2986422 RepID=UPI002240C773|nr:ElyC/SanA/YdcF family protein [Oerskovia sp. JB1-3-2]
MTRHAGLTAVALGSLLAAPVLWVQLSGRGHVRTADTMPRRPVALVLGAGLRPDGTPSAYLRRRLEGARRLYERGTVTQILVSGDGARPGYDEPEAMAAWLVERGVPAEHVVRDPGGLDTHDSCVRAHDVFGVRGAVVVTQDYHLPRAVFSCASAGIDTVGLGVSSVSVDPAAVLWYRVREVLASVRAARDALVRRRPVHRGRRLR